MNFNYVPVHFYQTSKHNWKKLLDSADKKWLSQGSSLPDKIKTNQKVIVPGLNLSLFFNLG
jgi:maltooligosyltrehalose trehalohydrolase